MSTPLAQWVVEFDGSSVQAVDGLLQDLGQKFEGIDQAARDAAGGINSALTEVKTNGFGGLSAAIQQAQKELLATENSAGGVAAALDFAREKSAQFEDLHNTLAKIDQDFGKGGVSAQVAHKAIDNVLQQVNGRLKEQKEKAAEMAEAHKRGALGVAAAYGVLTGMMGSWIRAGMQGTVEGERLGMTMQLLSREVASVFTPAIHGLTNALQNVLQWFRGMSGETQQTIGKVAGIAVAFLGLATILPKIAAGIKMMGESMMAAFAANPILTVVAAIAALLVNTEAGRAAIGSLISAVAPLADALGKTIGSIMEALTPALEAVATVIGTIAEAIKPVIEAFAPVIEIVGQIVGLIAGVLGGALKMIADIVKTVLVPVFELLRPIFELIAFVIKAISAVGSFFAKLLGLGGDKDKKKEGLNQKSGGFENFEATWERLQTAASKTDIAREQRDRMIRALEWIGGNTNPRPAGLGGGNNAVSN